VPEYIGTITVVRQVPIQVKMMLGIMSAYT